MLKTLLLKLGIWLISLKEEEILAAIYVALIITGRRAFADVPENVKPMVIADLQELGLSRTGHLWHDQGRFFHFFTVFY